MILRAFPYVEVSGSSYDMGYQHGAQAAELVKIYLQWIEKLTGVSRDVLCQNALHFLPMIRALSEPYLEEIQGLADGAAVSFEEALLCQARTEAAHVGEGACTSFALTGSATAGGQPLAGQNQDLEPEYAEAAILLHVRPTDRRPSALIFTFAGQLGYAGMNRHGLALFHTALYDYQWRLGVPRYPLERVLLEQDAVEKGVDLLSRHRTCSAGNILLCDRHGHIADVEVRPEAIALYDDAHSDCCVHTNHYLTRQFAPYETNSLPDSRPRLDRMRTLIRQNWGTVTVEVMKAILADHENDPRGICRHGGQGIHSISGYIAEPATGLLHVRHGHGCVGTWQTYEV